MIKVFLFIILQISVLLSPPILFAHETQSDNGIGAILHVDPGDAPVAGEKSTLFFEFLDMEEKLDLANCDCQITIKRGDQELLKESFSEADDAKTSGAVEFVFPESDIYKAIVSGKPQTEGQFKPFNLTFLIRVEKTNLNPITEAHNRPNNTWYDHAVHYLPAAVIIMALLGALIFTKNKKKIAVIILVCLLLGHSLPIKAIHASHGEPLDTNAFHCCLPTAAIMPLPVLTPEIKSQPINEILFSTVNHSFSANNFSNIRPPPSSS